MAGQFVILICVAIDRDFIHRDRIVLADCRVHKMEAIDIAVITLENIQQLCLGIGILLICIIAIRDRMATDAIYRVNIAKCPVGIRAADITECIF